MYKPLLLKREIDRRKKFQEKVYKELKSVSKKKKIKILGKNIWIFPDAFAHKWKDSSSLAKCVRKEATNNDEVLDMGTGTGIQGIFAAEKAKSVLAVDINPNAIKCAKFNIKEQGLGKKIKVLKSDLFSNINKKFDLIIFNPPFRWFKPRDILERGELDENYKTLEAFFKKAKSYLRKNGRILLVFSNSGDLAYLEFLIAKYSYKEKIMAKEISEEKWLYVVYKLQA